MNKISVGILGAGGHTRSLLNLIDQSIYNVCGIFDDSFDNEVEEIIRKEKVIGNLNSILPHLKLILSIGDNQKRKDYFRKYMGRLLLKNLMHKTAIIEDSAKLGNSNQIFANTYINSYATVGNNNIINSGCIIEHEVKIGNHNHISVGSIICGRTTIGNECFIGAGTVIIDKLKICDHVNIGANSVVVKDITESGVYVGNPVRKIK